MNLHDEMGRHGADATAESAARLESAEVLTVLGGRVRRGRRARNLGAAGVVAAFAVMAVGAWSLLPVSDREVDPAEVSDVVRAGPYEYHVTVSSPLDEPEVYLEGASAVACGDTVDLTPGITVHDLEGYERALWMRAQLGPPQDLEEWLAGDQLEELSHSGDQSVWAMEAGGENISVETKVMQVEGGQVVAVGSPAEANLGGKGASAFGAVPMPGPSVGQCAGGHTGGAVSDPADSVMVTQMWAMGFSSPDQDTLLATVVVDPNTLPPIVEPTSEPEESSASAEPTATASAALVEPLIDLFPSDDALGRVCGDSWDLEPGEYTHAAQPGDVVGDIKTGLIEPEPQNPSGWKVISGVPGATSDIAFIVGTFAVVDGTVVDTGVPQYFANFAKQFVLADDGESFNAVPDLGCADFIGVTLGSEYERHWVVQAVYQDGESVVPLKTWVDPGGSMTLDVR